MAINTLPTQTRRRQDEISMQIPADVVKEFIIRRMARRDPPWRVAALAQANFHIEIDSAQVFACWRDRNAPPTHTGPIQNQESMQIPTDR
jgi:hypothetical protein